MDQKYLFFRGLTEAMNLPAEPLPGLPVAQLWGDGRVLIENHRGVMGYSDEEVLVKVSYGTLRICGEKLKLSLMTTDQLIIAGNIHICEIQRR